MREAADRILRYTAGITEEQFRTNEQLLDAVVWNPTVLGEAAKHIPSEIERAFPNLPWPQMRGIRNRIVHTYDQLDPSILWIVASVELPPLIHLIDQLIAEGEE